MGRVLAFAADFEDQLAAWPARHQRTPFARAVERALTPCLLPLGGPPGDTDADDGEDVFLVDEDVPEVTLARLRAAGLRFARPARDVPVRLVGSRFIPWGAAPSLVERARGLGLEVDAPPADVVRRVNSKAWSHTVERELGVAVPGARLVASVEEARAAVAAAGARRWVVKDPFGVAGRGRFLGQTGALDERGSTWIARAMQAHPRDPLVFEPWLEVTGELGVQLHVGREGVRALGVTVSVLDDAGHYVGSRIGLPPGPLEPEIVGVALAAGRRLASEGYFGPAGIDALIHRGAEERGAASPAARPLCEINARHTMGMVALRFRPLLPPGGVGSWLLLPGRAMAATPEEIAARAGLAPYDPRTREGALVASPTPSERPPVRSGDPRAAGGVAVFLATRDPTSLLAAERAVLACGR